MGKNISKNIKNGTILQTRDEYLHNQGNYRKLGYENKGNYRKVVVVDSNSKDELAIVKLYSKSGLSLPVSNSRYKPFVETLDDKNRRIVVSKKFIKTKQKLCNYDVSVIKKNCFTIPAVRLKNLKKVRTIKGRTKI